MTKKINYIIILFASLIHLLISIACKKDNNFHCTISAGKIITEERTSQYFHTIIIKDKIDVYLKQDSKFSISIKAGKNLMKNIITEIKNETLYVSNSNKCNFMIDPKKKIEAHIHLPQIKYLKHIGSGNVYTLNTFIQDSIIIRMETPGDIHMQVQTSYFGGSTHGNGDLYISGQTNYFYYNYMALISFMQII